MILKTSFSLEFHAMYLLFKEIKLLAYCGPLDLKNLIPKQKILYNLNYPHK